VFQYRFDIFDPFRSRHRIGVFGIDEDEVGRLDRMFFEMDDRGRLEAVAGENGTNVAESVGTDEGQISLAIRFEAAGDAIGEKPFGGADASVNAEECKHR